MNRLRTFSSLYFCRWRGIVLVKEELEHIGHLVLPFDCHHHGVTLGNFLFSFQILDRCLYVNFTTFPFLDLSCQEVKFSFSDGHEVLDKKVSCGYDVECIKHGQKSSILVDDGSSNTSVLNAGMPTNLIFGTEDAVDFGDFLCVCLVPVEINLNEKIWTS